MTGRELYNRFRIGLELTVKVYALLPRTLRIFLYAFFQYGDWFLPAAIRYLSFRTLCASCGEVIKVGSGVVVKGWSNLHIGNRVNIHEYCFIDAIGHLSIGNDVSIAHSSSILTFEHTWDDTDSPIKYNQISTSPVTIDEDVWVGCGVRILAGADIKSRVVLAAGAVVVKGVYDSAIFAGVPAKKIKDF